MRVIFVGRSATVGCRARREPQQTNSACRLRFRTIWYACSGAFDVSHPLLPQMLVVVGIIMVSFYIVVSLLLLNLVPLPRVELDPRRRLAT